MVLRFSIHVPRCHAVLDLTVEIVLPHHSSYLLLNSCVHEEFVDHVVKSRAGWVWPFHVAASLKLLVQKYHTQYSEFTSVKFTRGKTKLQCRNWRNHLEGALTHVKSSKRMPWIHHSTKCRSLLHEWWHFVQWQFTDRSEKNSITIVKCKRPYIKCRVFNSWSRKIGNHK